MFGDLILCSGVKRERERVEKDQIEGSYGFDLGIILILKRLRLRGR